MNITRTFYDINGNPIQYKLDIAKQIGDGCCGKIYQQQKNKILKVYNTDCDDSARLAKSISDIINDINDSHLPSIDSILYASKPKEHIDDDTPIEGYTRNYISDERIKILFKSKEYILENIADIIRLFDICSEYNILIDDLKKANTILGKEHIVLIDPDTWFYCDYEYEELVRENRKKLLILLKELCFSEIIKQEGIANFNNIIDYLFDVSYEKLHTIDVAHEISKKLCKCKYPIDYLLHNKK